MLSRVLVTGATGFIGRHVCKTLAGRGFQVSALVRPESDRSVLSEIDVRFIDCGTGTPDEWLSQSEAQTIVHCAAAYGRDDPTHADVFQTNVTFPFTLLQAATKSQLLSFVHLDTCFTTDYPYLLPYTTSKKQMKQWGKLVASTCDIRFINLELQHPFGPGDRDGKFVPWIIKRCIDGGTIDLTDGAQRKDFIFVSDVAEAVGVLLCDTADTPDTSDTDVRFQHYQCGRGHSISVREFVEKIHQQTSSAAELRFGALPTRPNEIDDSVADIRALADKGWSPQIELDQAITMTIEAAKA